MRTTKIVAILGGVAIGASIGSYYNDGGFTPLIVGGAIVGGLVWVIMAHFTWRMH